MFKINYRITTAQEELKHLSKYDIDIKGCVQGYFQLEVNNKKYGYINKGELRGDEHGFEFIFDWFEGLLAVLIELKKGTRLVNLNEIESYNTWVKFKYLKNEMICISIVEAEKDGAGLLETRPLSKISYRDWSNEVVSYHAISCEVITQANEYLQFLSQLNKEFLKSNRFLRLKNMITQFNTSA